MTAQRWQPIETAPHGVPVLLFSPNIGASSPSDMEVDCASWGWRRAGISTVSFHGRATHWMPLPAPPVSGDVL